MTKLPKNFQFSQYNLQDFVDCPRRFELRHVLRQNWPAIQSEPALEQERRLRLGQKFHEIVHQSMLGVSSEMIASQINDPELSLWWQNFQQSQIATNFEGLRLPEFTLAAPFLGHRLIAKYDALLVESSGKVLIIDWKTGPKPIPKYSLSRRLQTHIYPFLVVEAGAVLNQGNSYLPQNIQMMYWFTADPDQPVVFQYNHSQYNTDRELLTRLIHDIEEDLASSFPLVPEAAACSYCVYRSLCNRGTHAGEMNDLEDDQSLRSEWEIQFEQIGEIEF